MDLRYSPEDEAFRRRVRAFLAAQLPADWRGWGAMSREEFAVWAPQWRSQLVAAGWLAPAWPTAYGGGGLSVGEQSILSEEFVRAGAPSYPLSTDGFGIALLGPTVMAFGSDAQKEQFLPPTITGDVRWAQGYSEPEAGSDLFSLRTRARLDGDEWVLDGEKVWQTGGMHANWIFVLARTDPEAAGAKGLSFLLVPVDQPGVVVRPIVNMAGLAEFASFTFTGARTATQNVVGGVGSGAKVALGLLGFERGAGGVAAAQAYLIELERLVALLKDRGRVNDPIARQRVAECYSRVRILHLLGLRALTAGGSGRPPGPESSIMKLYGAEYHQFVTEFALEVLGPDVVAPTGQAAMARLGPDPRGVESTSANSWTTIAMLARAGTIYGGSSQIQRNTIAEQILGLPREPRVTIAVNRGATAHPRSDRDRLR